MFNETCFTKEELETFMSRRLNFSLGYADAAVLGMGLSAELEHLAAYFAGRPPKCPCENCDMARARGDAIIKLIADLRAGIERVWPELTAEARRQQAMTPRNEEDQARANVAAFLSIVTGREVKEEDIMRIPTDPGDELPDLACYSPTVGHG